jgi:hypothetical protein
MGRILLRDNHRQLFDQGCINGSCFPGMTPHDMAQALNIDWPLYFSRSENSSMITTSFFCFLAARFCHTFGETPKKHGFG